MKNGEVKSLKTGDHLGEQSRAFMRENSKICMGFNQSDLNICYCCLTLGSILVRHLRPGVLRVHEKLRERRWHEFVGGDAGAGAGAGAGAATAAAAAVINVFSYSLHHFVLSSFKGLQ